MPAESCAPAASILTPELITLVVVPVLAGIGAWFVRNVLGIQTDRATDKRILTIHNDNELQAMALRVIKGIEEQAAAAIKAGLTFGSDDKKRAADNALRLLCQEVGIACDATTRTVLLNAALHDTPGLGSSGVGAAGKGVPEGPAL